MHFRNCSLEIGITFTTVHTICMRYLIFVGKLTSRLVTSTGTWVPGYVKVTDAPVSLVQAPGVSEFAVVGTYASALGIVTLGSSFQ
jgi:hypothetical protein